jgi:hypothetical protein
LSAIIKHGEQKVEQAIEVSLKHGQQNLLFLSQLMDSDNKTQNDVPEPLRHYVVESARATDFDALLMGGVA